MGEGDDRTFLFLGAVAGLFSLGWIIGEMINRAH